MGCEQSACKRHSKTNHTSEVPEIGVDFSDSCSDTTSGEHPADFRLAAVALDRKERLNMRDMRQISLQSACKPMRDDFSSSIETRDTLQASIVRGNTCQRQDDSADDISEAVTSETADDQGSEVHSEADSCQSCAKHVESEEPRERRPKKRKTITEKTMMEASGCLQVIIEKAGDVNRFYDFQQTLGEGSFGKVKKANVKASGAVRAVKAISKAAMKGKSHALKKEIRVGKIVDHPHIIKLYEIFEDDETINLVMEICVHGNLEDLVLKRKQCSQQQTARIMRQILSGVYYMHKSLICHRDLKPENVLVARQNPLTLKITDFGLSCFFTPGEPMTSKVGSPAFMAPEVIRRKYTEICDMWSCGVIMYFALCGYVPFGGETSAHVMKKVAHGYYAFETIEWVDVDQKTMDFIGLMMKKNPRARYTVEQAIHHDWFTQNLAKVQPVELRFDLLDNLVSFRNLNRLKRSALIVVASMLRTEDVLENHKLFLALDCNGDGLLTLPELQKSVKRFKSVVHQKAKFMEGDLGKFFVDTENVDARKKPFTYTEFLAATFDRNRIITDAICTAAFASFDKNGDGKISLSELSQGHLLGHLSLEELAQALEELDLDGDSFLDLKEFTEMLTSS